MQEDLESQRDRRPIKMFGILLPSLPSLMIRLSGTFLRFKKNAQRAEKVFKKELIKQGIDKQTANELTERYIEGSRLSNFIQIMR